jgi:hypothetical protein
MKPFQDFPYIYLSRTNLDTTAAAATSHKTQNLWEKVKFLQEAVAQPLGTAIKRVGPAGYPAKIGVLTGIP